MCVWGRLTNKKKFSRGWVKDWKREKGLVPRRPRYRVQWTDTANRDLESIVDFIAQDNVNAAIEVLNNIRKTASTLQAMPKRGRVVPELAEFGLRIYHEILFAPWRIIYRISSTNVFVIGVVDSRRNLEDILLERLLR